MNSTSITTLIAAALVLMFACVGQSAMAGPMPPCQGTGPVPGYGPTGAHPTVQIFHDAVFDGPKECLGPVQGPVELAIVLSGQFNATRAAADIAARIGAISDMTGLIYWSTTRAVWRPLISEAYAVTDATNRNRRPDFTTAEILSGKTHYFIQNDTQSSGLNLYEMTIRSSTPTQLTIEIVNVSPVRLAFVTLFESRSLVSIHNFVRLNDRVWGYYGLSAITAGLLPGAEKSLVNRGAALYRHLAGIPPDTEPPLAP